MNIYRCSLSLPACAPIAAVLCLIVLAAGCSGIKDQPDIAPVHGVVTLDGAPLAGASITFNQPGFRSSIGNTDSEGHYELIYIRDIRGAVLGEHEVKIKVFDKGGPRVPARYNNASELTAVVEPGSNEINFDLEATNSAN